LIKVKLKPLREQVMVITGATSGIGLVTARMAAQHGCQLYLIARSEQPLRQLCRELDPDRSRVAFGALDVADRSAVQVAAKDAIETFGRIDTWVNNAGVSIYGRLEEHTDEDSRRLFDTNFWGTVNGCLAALGAMRDNGGAIINIGSTLSDRAIPIQGMYCASKHAVKGFTDAFRMELEAENIPISVTLIKPSAIDTPYKEHAKNYMGVHAENPPPVYAPETVAETILHCAQHPTRDVFVGGGGKALQIAGTYAPRLTDRYMESVMIDMQKTEIPINNSPIESLHAPADMSLTERGGYGGHVAKSSVYTRASLHPWISAAALIVAAGTLTAGIAGLATRRNRNG
jgi:short-subunit dehydrogenase